MNIPPDELDESDDINNSDDFNEIFHDSNINFNVISTETDIINDQVSEQKEAKEFEKEGDIKKRSVEHLYNKRFRQNTKLRKSVIKWVRDVVSIWVSVVLMILCLNNSMFKISDNVMIVLLSTTTINVLGLMAIAMKDLFNGKSEDKK